MALFKKRETLTQNIAYMAIMAAINVVFCLLSTLVPVLMFLIIFVLPLTNTVVALFCKKKYFPIYAIATVGLCSLVTMWNISDVFFHVIPSIFTGLLFAILVEKKVNTVWIILSTTLLQVGFSYAFIPLINLIYGRNYVQDFAAIFGLKDYKYLDYIVPCAIFLIALIQSAFSYLVTKEEIEKLGFFLNDKDLNFPIIGILQFVSSGLLVLFVFFVPQLTLLTLVIIILIGCYVLVNLFTNFSYWSLILLVISLFASIFIFAICYILIPSPFSILLVGVFFIMVTIIGFANNYLFHKKKLNDTI